MRFRLAALGLSAGAILGVGCFSGSSAQQDGGEDRIDALIPDAAAPSSCDPLEAPGDGVYVSASHGDDDAGDGSPLRPYLTLGAAIEAAAVLSQATIYVEEGTYPESITIRPSTTGVRLRGGWVSAGTAWSRTCPPGVVARTVIAPTSDPVAVHVEGAVTASGLELLTIATKSHGASLPDTSGETVIGVLVDGEGAAFALTDVDVLMGDGGDGGQASMGDAGATAPAALSCFLGAACSDGTMGGVGDPGSVAAAGQFGPDGYVPGDAGDGMPGGSGENGTPSPQGPQQSSSCKEDCSCSGSCNSPTTTRRGGDGRCGCGGGGGGGGFAGRGGGASIAVMVVGGSTLGVTRGRLLGGDGGDGSLGGSGGQPAEGAAGAPGSTNYCHSGCATGGAACEVNCYSHDDRPLGGGMAGGPGGPGGLGGTGGAGAGGHSYVMVERAGGHVVLSGAVVVAGNPGRGAGQGDAAAPSGEADTLLTLP